MRDFASAVASMGERGDDSVAHVRTGEMVIPQSRMTPKLMSAFLEAMGSTDPSKFVVGNPANQRNTATGMPMFADDENDGSAGFGAGEGDFSDPSGPGFNDSAMAAYEASIGGRPGGGLSTEGYNRENDPNFGMDPTGGAAIGGGGGGVGVGTVGRTIAGGLAGLAGLPANFGGFVAGPAMAAFSGSPMSLADTFGAYSNLAPGFGLATQAARGAAQLGGFVAENTLGRMGATATDGPGGEGLNDGAGNDQAPSLGEQMAAETAKQNFTPPAAMQAPASLRLNPQMTELQQRAMVASRGTQGDDSRYRTEEAQNFYRNLLQRALIGQGGAVNPLSDLLPVDMQFIQQVLGIQPPDSSSALLQAIANT